MISLCVVLLTAVYSMVSFTILLSKRMAAKDYVFIAAYLFMINPILQPYLGQWGIFPMILVISIIVYWGCNHSILDVILSLTGYLIAILVKHFIPIPLNALRLSLNIIQIQHPIALLLALILTISFLLFFTKKFFISKKLCYLQSIPHNLQKLFLAEILLGICLFTAHFIYGNFIYYPWEVLIINSILTAVFTLCTIILFFSLYQIFQHNYQLSRQKKELNVMQEYMDSMEKFYDEVRIFRHDYKNILSTLEYYIDTNDTDGLKTYFHEKILSNQAPLSNNP